MKVALIMARGIEGCGVTKFTVEQASWLEKNNYDYTIYASADKKWSRAKSHVLNNTKLFKFAEKEPTDAMIKECNEADLIIVNSLPSIGHPEACIDAFKRFLNETTTPLALIQHDHSSLSIKRNAAMEEVIERASVIFAHSRDNDFCKYVDEISGGGPLAGFMGEDSTPIKNFQPGMDFDAVRTKYWNDDINVANPLYHKWIGRTTTWKGFKPFFAFHNNYLRPNGYISMFEGIERSPAFMVFKEVSDFHNHVSTAMPGPEDTDMKVDELAYVFGPYINDEMLQRMSRTGFGYQLSILKPRFIERSIEYTHCEVACTGTIPVFRKAYGDRCTHRHYGKPLSECADSGTIWLDDDNMESAIELVNELAKDTKLRSEWREAAYEFYKLHQDSSYVFKEMMDNIESEIS